MACDQYDVVIEQRPGLQFARLQGEGDDSQFEPAVGDVLGDLPTAGLLHVEHDLGVGSLKGGDGRWQNEGHRRGASSDPDLASFQPLVAPNLLAQGIPARKQSLTADQHESSFLGQLDAVAVANQQACAQLFLVLLDTARQRRLGQAQLVGGLGDGAGFGHGKKRTGQGQFHACKNSMEDMKTICFTNSISLTSMPVESCLAVNPDGSSRRRLPLTTNEVCHA